MTADKPLSLVPKLRFPEFINHEPWHTQPLDDLCVRLSETVGDIQLTPVSISVGKGFVSQAQKFGRDISGSQYSRYIWLRRGDFAYNRGNSKRFPQGCVYQLIEFDEAAASNAFHCFRLQDHCVPKFVLGFFENNGSWSPTHPVLNEQCSKRWPSKHKCWYVLWNFGPGPADGGRTEEDRRLSRLA